MTLPSAAATIFALSSGRPPAAIAVVRVSGPRAFDVLTRLTGGEPPPPRVLARRDVIDPDSCAVVDRALVVGFLAPASVTGENLVEFHLHGGGAVIAAVLRLIGSVPGVVAAAPGAFTRQAFDNAKLDLAEVEGLADLIDAETEGQRVQAMATAGILPATAGAWRATLIELLADVESRLDFADEAEVAAADDRGLAAALDPLIAAIAAAEADADRGARLRDGLTIAIVGAPNVGKSSLLNAFARRDVAIVMPTAGTTRDVLEVRLDLGGVAVTVLDTAGLRDSDDPAEAEGIRRGRARAAAADLIVDLGGGEVASSAVVLRVVNKIDLSGEPPGLRDGAHHISTLTGAGLAGLEAWLTAWAVTTVRPGEPALVTRARHRAALAAGLVALRAARAEPDPVLCAERLRNAVTALAGLTGRVASDDILDAIFGRFCIGK